MFSDKLYEGMILVRAFKQSPLSLMINFFSNLKKWVNKNVLKELIEKAVKYDGVPGCGKTYKIAKRVDENTVVVSMTR